MPHPAFAPVTTWVFDLDNTLYPPEAGLFDLIAARMTDWVIRELGQPRQKAESIRAAYWMQHGTTLAGLMAEHGTDPVPFLDEVHDVPLDTLAPDPVLAAAIAALPGRRIVYTNACVPYARRVLAARGLAGLFDDVFGVEDADYHPKPEAEAYRRVFAKAGLDPSRAAMFEDDPRNLLVPHSLGLRTVLVAPESGGQAAQEPHVGFHTPDLARFLREHCH